MCLIWRANADRGAGFWTPTQRISLAHTGSLFMHQEPSPLNFEIYLVSQKVDLSWESFKYKYTKDAPYKAHHHPKVTNLSSSSA